MPVRLLKTTISLSVRKVTMWEQMLLLAIGITFAWQSLSSAHSAHCAHSRPFLVLAFLSPEYHFCRKLKQIWIEYYCIIPAPKILPVFVFLWQESLPNAIIPIVRRETTLYWIFATKTTKKRISIKSQGQLPLSVQIWVKDLKEDENIILARWQDFI